MLRDLQNVIGRNVDAMYVAGVKHKYGQLVEKTSNFKTKHPTAGAVKNIHFVTKPRVIYGDYKTERPDTDPLFENIEIGEKVVLRTPIAGEVFGLDNITGTVVENDYVKVTADGNLEKDASLSDSTFGICRGKVNLAGVELHIIEVL